MTTFELLHSIDGASVEGLRRHLNRQVVAPPSLHVACDRVTALDPVGAALLWMLCRNVEQSVGTRIRLTGMGQDLIQRLRSHPLQEFLVVGEELFSDPFGSRPPSQR